MKQWIVNLDLVKVVAIILVISVHFFNMTGFTDTNFCGFNILFMLPLFWLAYSCIGLWIILTGYLCGKDKFNKKYLYKLFRILFSYILISIIIIIYENVINHSGISVGMAISQILSFKVNSYVWYVEMYVGLFLLIPFLNILYDKLKKKQKKLLIIVLMIVSSLTATLYFFIPSRYYTSLFSDYWSLCFPLMFYFIGRYIKDYPLKISNLKKAGLILLILIIQSLLTYGINYEKTFPLELKIGQIGAFYNLFTVAVAILLFSFIKDLSKIKLKKAVTTIASVTFEMYLISNLFDNLLYGYILKIKFEFIGNYLIHYLLAISFVFITSFLTGFIINRFVGFVSRKLYPIYDKKFKCKFLN